MVLHVRGYRFCSNGSSTRVTKAENNQVKSERQRVNFGCRGVGGVWGIGEGGR